MVAASCVNFFAVDETGQSHRDCQFAERHLVREALRLLIAEQALTVLIGRSIGVPPPSP